MNSVTFTIEPEHLTWLYIGIKFIAAMVLQKKYKIAQAQTMELPISGAGLWGVFVRNLIIGFEFRIIKVLIYPLYAIVVGRKTFKQWMSGESYDC